jgi:hypothetical protein
MERTAQLRDGISLLQNPSSGNNDGADRAAMWLDFQKAIKSSNSKARQSRIDQYKGSFNLTRI